MPRMDGTGPNGTGPIGGICYRRANNVNNNYGCGRGLGRGLGRGRGEGFNRGYGFQNANPVPNKELLKEEKERLVQRIEEINKLL